MLTRKIVLPDSHHPIIIGNNLGFWALHLAGQNEFRFFVITKKTFFIFGHWHLPEKFTVAQKIMAFPGWYAYGCGY